MKIVVTAIILFLLPTMFSIQAQSDRTYIGLSIGVNHSWL